MANADFSQNQNPNPGGFDAGSYREAAPKTETARLTPAQQKLAGLEAALPAALRTQGAALALSVVVMLAAFFGFGGAKLKAKANEAAKWYTVGVSADGGYTLSEELTTRANTAANILTTGSNTLGADNADDGGRAVELAVLALHRAHLHGVSGLLLQFCIELVDGRAQRRIGLIECLHGAALIIGQRRQGLFFATVLHGFQTGVEIAQRILRGQHLGVVGPQRVAAGGENIRRRVGAGGQLFAQAVAAVG